MYITLGMVESCHVYLWNPSKPHNNPEKMLMEKSINLLVTELSP